MIRRPPRSTLTDTLFPYTTLCRSGEQPPFVETVRAILPEFDAQRGNAIARPMWRARHLKPFVARLHGREPRLEGRAAIERTRLIRGPGAELRIAAAGGEIGIGLGIGDDAPGAFDANLPGQRDRKSTSLNSSPQCALRLQAS